MKAIEFRGDSLDVLRSFPDSARKQVGNELRLVQNGIDPEDWKPILTVGAGVREIRVRDERGIFRVMYVAKFADAIYVLHCFQKKTQKTSESDLELGRRRYRELFREQSR
jgi:phage-related protein